MNGSLRSPLTIMQHRSAHALPCCAVCSLLTTISACTQVCIGVSVLPYAGTLLVSLLVPKVFLVAKSVTVPNQRDSTTNLHQLIQFAIHEQCTEQQENRDVPHRSWTLSSECRHCYTGNSCETGIAQQQLYACNVKQCYLRRGSVNTTSAFSLAFYVTAEL